MLLWSKATLFSAVPFKKFESTFILPLKSFYNLEYLVLISLLSINISLAGTAWANPFLCRMHLIRVILN